MTTLSSTRHRVLAKCSSHAASIQYFTIESVGNDTAPVVARSGTVAIGTAKSNEPAPECRRLRMPSVSDIVAAGRIDLVMRFLYRDDPIDKPRATRNEAPARGSDCRFSRSALAVSIRYFVDGFSLQWIVTPLTRLQFDGKSSYLTSPSAVSAAINWDSGWRMGVLNKGTLVISKSLTWMKSIGRSGGGPSLEPKGRTHSTQSRCRA